MTFGARSILSTSFEWKNKEYIDEHTYSKLLVTDGILPCAYRLPKIHKHNVPLRIIVSCINRPLYHIASYLYNIIKKSIPSHFSSIENNYRTHNHGLPLDPNYTLNSLDVMSLFTNIKSSYWQYKKKME